MIIRSACVLKNAPKEFTLLQSILRTNNLAGQA